MPFSLSFPLTLMGKGKQIGGGAVIAADGVTVPSPGTYHYPQVRKGTGKVEKM